MNILILILSLVVFVITGSFTGFIILKKLNMDRKIASSIAVGTVVNILGFNLISLLASLISLKLMIAGTIWLAGLVMTAIYVLVRYKSEITPLLKNNGNDNKNLKQKRLTIVFSALIVILILLQVIGCYIYSFDQPDAVSQVGLATYSYDTGIISAKSPMMMLWAYIGKFFGCHPLIIIFSISEFVMIPLSYLVAWEISGELFDNCNKRLFFMLCVNMLNLWGYQSGYAINTALLFSYFSGTVYILYCLLPTLLWLILNKYEIILEYIKKEKDINESELINRTGEPDYYEWEEEDMKKHRIVNARTVAIALLFVVILLVGSVYIMNNKINSLYNTTVNLQSQVNEGCKMYEYVPKDESEAVANLIKQSDGSLIMFGGGSRDEGDAIYDFISEYGTEVKVWYLLSENENDKGAYDYCVGNKGIKVDKTMVMNAKELENN